MKVVHTSYERPIFDNDIISIVSYDDNDEETKYKINFSGTKLSEGNVLDLSIESGEVVPQSEDKQEPVEEVKDIVVPIVTIGRFIFVNDDSVKLSEHSNLIYSKKSLSHEHFNIKNNNLNEIKIRRKHKAKYTKMIKELFCEKLNDFRSEIVIYCINNSSVLDNDNFENFVCFLEFALMMSKS